MGSQSRRIRGVAARFSVSEERARQLGILIDRTSGGIGDMISEALSILIGEDKGTPEEAIAELRRIHKLLGEEIDTAERFIAELSKPDHILVHRTSGHADGCSGDHEFATACRVPRRDQESS